MHEVCGLVSDARESRILLLERRELPLPSAAEGSGVASLRGMLACGREVMVATQAGRPALAGTWRL
jgi:hypothetical protein